MESRKANLKEGLDQINQGTNPMDANIAWAQIGTMNKMAMGARNATSSPTNLTFQVGSGRPLKKVIVTLNAWDLYDVQVVLINMKTLKFTVKAELESVDAENLGDALVRLVG